MIKFRNYPIHVVYSRHTQDDADNTAADFYNAGDKHMYEWMKSTGKVLMEIVEDSAPIYRQEALAYENAIKKQLDTIVATPVGKCLFDMLDPDTKIWILPDPNLAWSAQTWPIKTVKEGGGIRMHFNPEDWDEIVDDTLVHEFTHAIRFGMKRFVPGRSPVPIGDFPTLEEFMATQVSNLYRSSLGKTRLFGTYNYFPGKFSDKGTIYSEFIENPTYIMALRYCIDREPMVQRLSKFPIRHPEFNPFRDLPILERMALGKMQVPGYGAGKFMRL